MSEFSQRTHSHNRDVNSITTNSKSNSVVKQNTKQGGKEKSREFPEKPIKPCSGFEKSHWKSECPFKNAECHWCKRKGHIAKICFAKTSSPTKPKSQPKSIRSVEQPESNSSNQTSSEYIVSLNSSNSVELKAPYYVKLKLDDWAEVDFQLDTGAARTLITEQEFFKMFPTDQPKILPYFIELNRYGGSKIPVRGYIKVKISYKGRVCEDSTIFIVKGKGPNQLGRDLMPALGFQVKFDDSSIHAVIQSPKSIMSKYPEVFKNELGTFKDLEVSFDLEESVSPRYCKARNVPYAMGAKVDAALDKLLEQDIIQPVSSSNWAAPIVPVLKEDGTIRICGDYRLTVNRATKVTNLELMIFLLLYVVLKYFLN